MSIAATFGGVVLARTIGGFVQKLSKRFFPFDKSSDKDRMVFQAQLTEEQQAKQQAFSKALQEAGLHGQKELAFISSVYARQTALQVNILNFQNALKTRLFEDALKNYPLNIPPLVMLHNSGLSTSSVIGDIVNDDPLVNDLIMQTKSGNCRGTIEDYQKILQKHPVALSVFITPLQLDSRVGFRDKLYSMVWDQIYQNLESIFISEYNRGGERPVIFYPSAWNLNAKPGLHASEILYFFTKGMPVIVLEPRYDGKNLRFLFSCWGIGETPERHIRQEITFDIKWEDIVLPIMYERSKSTYEKLAKLTNPAPIILDTLKKSEHNIRMYENLSELNLLSSKDGLDDISKYFYISNQDYSVMASMMSEALGISISLIADVHHLTSRGISPLFPDLMNRYFHNTFKYLSKPDRDDLMNSINGMMRTAYTELLLGDAIVDSEYNSFEKAVTNELNFSDDRVGLKEMLKSTNVSSVISQKNIETRNNSCKHDLTGNIDIIALINEKAKIYNITVRSLREKVKLIADYESGFYQYLSEVCESQAMTIEEIIGNE